MFDFIPRLLTFLVAFYDVLVPLEVEKLDRFICKYQNDSIEAISVFASGLKKDYDALKNCLIYPNFISFLKMCVSTGAEAIRNGIASVQLYHPLSR
jgi:hypothetical protein